MKFGPYQLERLAWSTTQRARVPGTGRFDDDLHAFATIAKFVMERTSRP